MQMYQLNKKLKDKKGSVPFLLTNYIEVPTDYYKDYISLTEFYDINETIYLYLTKFKGGNLILRDYLTWDLGRPNAYFIVCSAKFSFTLTDLNLPNYKFYKAEVDVKGKKHKYYVLHFIQDYLQDIDYSCSQFAEVELMENYRIKRICEIGEIKNVDEYHTKNKKLVENMLYMYPQKICFKPEINYDVWGLKGQIIISEKAKIKIETDGITGIDMPPLKDVEIQWKNTVNSVKI